MIKNKIINAAISINSICNLKCGMCSIGQANIDKDNAGVLTKNWKVDDEISPQDWLKIIKKLNITHVNINGTEPLLYKELEELLILLKNNNCHVSLLTNGWFIKKNLDILVKYVDKIRVSIDGGTQTTHDKIRGVNGSFKKVMDGLNMLIKNNKDVFINYAVLPENIREIPEFNKHMKKNGVKVTYNHFIYIDGESCKSYACAPTNMNCYNPKNMNIELLHNIISECEDAIWRPNLIELEDIKKYYHESPYERKKGKCYPLLGLANGNNFRLNAKGDFLISHNCWIEKKLGNALVDDSLKNKDWINQTIEDISGNGLYEPCQRLCCATVFEY